MQLKNNFFGVFIKIIFILVALAMIGGATAVIGIMIVCGGLSSNSDKGNGVFFLAVVVGLVGIYFLGFTIKNIIKSKHTKLNDKESALVDFIKSAKSQGIIDEQIKERLKNEGHWSDQEVDGAYKKIN